MKTKVFKDLSWRERMIVLDKEIKDRKATKIGSEESMNNSLEFMKSNSGIVIKK